jgi:hypothetical protein
VSVEAGADRSLYSSMRHNIVGTSTAFGISVALHGTGRLFVFVKGHLGWRMHGMALGTCLGWHRPL